MRLADALRGPGPPPRTPSTTIVRDPVDDEERIVLSTDYDVQGVPHAVVMTDARWRGGTGTGDD